MAGGDDVVTMRGQVRGTIDCGPDSDAYTYTVNSGSTRGCEIVTRGV